VGYISVRSLVCLILWRRVHILNLIVTHLMKTFPAFYGMQKFMASQPRRLLLDSSHKTGHNSANAMHMHVEVELDQVGKTN